MTIESDTDILNNLRYNDYASFRKMYERYWLPLVTYAYKRLRNYEDAEEIVQDVYIDIYKRRSVIEIEGSLEAYLHTAVRYRVYNKFREWIRQEKSHELLQVENDTVLPQYIPEEKETEAYLQNAINVLPDKCKEVFLLSRDEKLSNKEIAEKLGISVNTVEKHIGRALQILRIEMKGYYSLAYVLLLMELWKR